MARKTPRPAPTLFTTLLPLTQDCPACGTPLLLDYYNSRTVTTLDGVVRLRLGIRRCHSHPCTRHRIPVRPEAEGRIGLPHHEFGLDVIRSEERRVGKECRSRWSPDYKEKKHPSCDMS